MKLRILEKRVETSLKEAGLNAEIVDTGVIRVPVTNKRGFSGDVIRYALEEIGGIEYEIYTGPTYHNIYLISY